MDLRCLICTMLTLIYFAQVLQIPMWVCACSCHCWDWDGCGPGSSLSFSPLLSACPVTAQKHFNFLRLVTKTITKNDHMLGKIVSRYCDLWANRSLHYINFLNVQYRLWMYAIMTFVLNMNLCCARMFLLPLPRYKNLVTACDFPWEYPECRLLHSNAQTIAPISACDNARFATCEVKHLL